MDHPILSTSTVASKQIATKDLGPLINDGFGNDYLTDDEEYGLLATSFYEECTVRFYARSRGKFARTHRDHSKLILL